MHLWARPHGHARAAVAALAVAHDVAPLGAVDVAVAVGEWAHDLVHGGIVAGADEVADLMGDGIGQGGAIVMHDGKRLLGLGEDARGKAATLGVVDDEHGNVGAVFVAQSMDLVHIAVALVGEAPDVIEMRALLDVVGLVGMHEPELDVAEAAHAEGFVRPPRWRAR